jgi:LmbE family N-acetylglucosaminyl deacetylase
MKKLIFPFLFLICFSFSDLVSYSQKTSQWSAGEILHNMKKLDVLGAVLYVAAHPDDENTRLIAHLAKERQYRTGYMAMTRGDGGQNLIGDEQGVELGLIRTQELLAARRTDGGEQFFSRAFDFGFSKRTDEALQMWDKEKILSDAVWVIRNFKPDVIITRFPEDSRAGHGHHSGSAVIAREAFIAAADPKRFPEHFQFGVKPWQAKRIMWNTSSFWSNNTTSEDQMKIEVGGYLPLLGKSIGEISTESRSQHRSQGFGSASNRGSAIEYFQFTLGDKAEKDIMEGVNTGWGRVSGGEKISAEIKKLINAFSFQQPASSIPALIALKKSIAGISDEYWRNLKMTEVQKLIQMCAGLHLDALADKRLIAQGDTLRMTASLINRSGVEISIESLDAEGTTYAKGAKLTNNQSYVQPMSILLDKNRPVGQPYWLVNPMSTGNFNVTDQRLIGKGQNDPAFIVKANLIIMGEKFVYDIPVMNRVVDPAIGEFFHPIIITPATTLTAQPAPVLINTANSNATAKPAIKPLPPVIQSIAYEHIPTLTYFSEAKQKVIEVDLKTTGKQIGYIKGAGDKVPAMIELMGYQVTELDRADITPEKLKQFDAVVVGVRAYNVNDWMGEKYDMLMDYVRNGGNMVVQYNTNSFAGPLQRMKIGPKPFIISRNRTTEEDCEIKFVDPQEQVLNFPNKITQDDFKGWIQERGIYYADGFASDYRAVLLMHDKGEPDFNGSIIVRNEGKGRFIYTGLVFFRELPAGVPGAFRLFANLISNPNLKPNTP